MTFLTTRSDVKQYDIKQATSQEEERLNIYCTWMIIPIALSLANFDESSVGAMKEMLAKQSLLY